MNDDAQTPDAAAAGDGTEAVELVESETTGTDWTDPEVIQELVVNVGLAIGLFILAWFIAGWAKRLVTKACTKANIELTLARFFGNMAKWAILAMGVLSILGFFGVDTTSFAAVLAAISFAIGFALQGSLSNIAAGIMLLIFRPFKIGDVVNAAGQTGKVFEIGLFSTLMDTPDNRRIIVPNGSIFGGTIENITFHDTRRVDVSVGTDYPANLDDVRSVLMKAAQSVDGILDDPAPAVVLAGLGDSAIDWSVRVWTKTENFFPVMDALTRAVKVELDAANIGIPFPQMDVHIDGSCAPAA